MSGPRLHLMTERLWQPELSLSWDGRLVPCQCAVANRSGRTRKDDEAARGGFASTLSHSRPTALNSEEIGSVVDQPSLAASSQRDGNQEAKRRVHIRRIARLRNVRSWETDVNIGDAIRVRRCNPGRINDRYQNA